MRLNHFFDNFEATTNSEQKRYLIWLYYFLHTKTSTVKWRCKKHCWLIIILIEIRFDLVCMDRVNFPQQRTFKCKYTLSWKKINETPTTNAAWHKFDASYSDQIKFTYRNKFAAFIGVERRIRWRRLHRNHLFSPVQSVMLRILTRVSRRHKKRENERAQREMLFIEMDSRSIKARVLSPALLDVCTILCSNVYGRANTICPFSKLPSQ